MLKKIFAISLVVAASNSFADPAAEACVDAKIFQFHIAEGVDTPIHYATLSEWEAECGLVESEDYYIDRDYNGQEYDEEGNLIDDSPAPVFVGKSATLPEYKLTSMSSNTGSGTNKSISYTSLEDKLVIDNIVVNRGRCKVSEVGYIKGRLNFSPIPLTLGYGDNVKIQINSNCDVLEVTADYNGITHTDRMESR